MSLFYNGSSIILVGGATLIGRGGWESLFYNGGGSSIILVGGATLIGRGGWQSLFYSKIVITLGFNDGALGF